MLLRTRITLIVAAGFIALMAIFWGASLVRDRLEQQRTADVAISAQAALWREIVATQITAIEQQLDEIENSPQLRVAMSFSSRQNITAVLAELGIDGSDDSVVFEAVGSDREVISLLADSGGRSLLDAGTLDKAFAGGRAAGLRAVSARQLLIVATRTVTVPGRGRVVLVLGRNASVALDQFATSVAAQAALVSLRGSLLDTTDPDLWEAAGLSFPPRQALYETREIAGRTYSVTSVPVDGITGGTVGALVSLKDNTAAWAAQSALRWAAIAAGIGMVVCGVIGLNIFLWFSFRPLENAIGVLQALSRGDTSVVLEHSGRDEIGRIAEAIIGLRANAQALAEVRRQRERVRRRQETMISAELESLADSIDPTDREEVLALLASPSAGEAEDELRRVARVLHDLSRRIVEQHTRLSSMVVELREALITKTKLAGIQQELEIARQVQLAILPKALPPDPRVSVHGHMTPAREVGGDFYDYFQIDESTLGFVVADVSGKGVPAALFMAISRTLLRATALFERSPAGCVRRLNDLLALENEQMLFVTVFYAVIDLDTGRVNYVNAGHNLPYRVSAGGDISTVPSTKGMAVAVMEGFVYREGHFDLEPGDSLFLFTDGVTEAIDIDGTLYCEPRLEALLGEGAAHWDVPEFAERVMASIRAFERGAPQADDITCLTLRYFGDHRRPRL
ncbi:SpoIIE family protein phosphatase [Aquabacter spiritensis]|uniref:Sigma-B regulation protein RsbU (Phosphoserine phosphatase) n=1 Tax=Aquabacter spiritensis TaxID=933073 RepID=A0A4V2UYM5_9HYPH|nr:SpoIIE family protein phosphatase [Aquabacter spiritensis]TCT07988.1 sigma-B regulation protein RsbU (phosphoserine phosphatase) [Aquabacter spiritensis]